MITPGSVMPVVSVARPRICPGCASAALATYTPPAAPPTTPPATPPPVPALNDGLAAGALARRTTGRRRLTSITLPSVATTEYVSGTNTSQSTRPTGISIFGNIICMSPFFANGVPA